MDGIALLQGVRFVIDLKFKAPFVDKVTRLGPSPFRTEKEQKQRQVAADAQGVEAAGAAAQ